MQYQIQRKLYLIGLVLMMKLQNIVSIEQRFQNSVNIRMDIMENDKISQYIPTSSSVQVMKHYLNNVLENEENATMLIGPYGKGKSHLILVLLKLLWLNGEDTQDEIRQLICRVKKVDEETAALMEKFVKEEKRYLPVVVTFGNEDLNTTYLYALNRALTMAGMDDLAPSTSYEKVEEMLEVWKNQYPSTYEMFSNVLDSEYAMDIVTFRMGIRERKRDFYQLFVELYPRFTSGGTFQPMIDTNAVKIYEEVNIALKEQYGYAGLFVVFDEFSKYVEMQDRNQKQLSGNMGFIQEMCELCAKKSNAIHHIFVAHKSIKEYGDYLSKATINCFTGVEGRLKEVHFQSGARDCYELIANTIRKIDKEWNVFQGKWWQDCHHLPQYQIPGFCGAFDEKEYFEIVVKGCFPLSPVTAFLLIKISENVGQNERSMFTFMAKKEKNSLMEFIRDSKGVKEAGPALVFDYFAALFYKEKSNPRIYEEYIKAKYVVDNLKDEDSLLQIKKSIVKMMALIRMIHIPDEVNVDSKTLRHSCNCSKEEFEQALRELEEGNFIVWRVREQAYHFKNQIGVDIETELGRVAGTIGKIDMETELQKISQFRYELPQSYNNHFYMTRYFDYIFMKTKAFLLATDTVISGLFEKHFADGKIIALIPDSVGKDDIRRIQEKVKVLANERILVLCPNETLELEQNIRRMLSIKKYIDILRENEENVKLLLEELNYLLEDSLFEIVARLETLYMPYNGHSTLFHMDKQVHDVSSRKEFNLLLSDICDRYYGGSPIIRHEMLNRRNISTQMRKAREIIIQSLLIGKDMSDWQKGTSAEATMFRATLFNTGLMNRSRNTDKALQDMLLVITRFIKDAQGDKLCFGMLYQILQGKKYGVRLGVIPIYLAYRFAQLEDMPVVYHEKREYAIDAKLLNRINVEPEKYYLYVEKNTVEKEEFIKSLAELWGCDANVNCITEEIANWFKGLPRYTIHGQYGVHDKTRDFCKYLLTTELNPREFVYEDLMKLCKTQDYSECMEVVTRTKKRMEGYLEHLVEEVVRCTKESLDGSEKDSLSALLGDWYHFLSPVVFEQVNSTYENAFLKVIAEIIDSISPLSEYAIISRLAKCITDLYVEDWREDTLDYYCSQMNKLISKFSQIEQSDTEGKGQFSFTNKNGEIISRYYNYEVDGTAEFLQNEMISIMEEFGESLENEQKVAVLVNMLEGLMKN